MGRRLLPRSGLLAALALLAACGPGGSPGGAGDLTPGEVRAPTSAAAPSASPEAPTTDKDLPLPIPSRADREPTVAFPLPQATGMFGRLPVGIDLRLLEREGARGVEVIISGPAWGAVYGCEAPTSLWLPGWGRSAQADLARVLTDALNAVRGDASKIEALLAPGSRKAAALRTDVFPLVWELASAGLAEVHVRSPSESRWKYPRDQPVMEMGLRWLFAHQEWDGSWSGATLGKWCESEAMRTPVDLGPVDPEAAIANTGLALMAYLGSGYTNRGRHRFARTVSKGLRYLKGIQQPDGAFGSLIRPRGPEGHALAALAMVEAYGMTGSPIFRRSAQKGLDRLPDAWREAHAEAVVTAWTTMAMASAILTNDDATRRGKPRPLVLDDELVRELRATLPGLGEVGGGWALAFEPYGRVLLGEPDRESAELTALAQRIARAPPRSEPAAGGPSLRGCYFGALSLRSLRRTGWPLWKPWQAAIEDALPRCQRRDGSACCFRGSWDPADGLGRTASTALAVLCLEVRWCTGTVLVGLR